MKPLLLLLFCISIRCSCYAQDGKKSPNHSISKNTIFGEFAGNSLLYSVSYDRILVNKEKWKFTGRLGFGYIYARDVKSSVFYLPSEFSFLIGKNKNFFEAGVGVSCLAETASQDYYHDEAYLNAYLFTRLGYRYQRPQGGFFFKVGVTPFIALTENARYPMFENSEFFGIWGGVGAGYTFKQKKK